MKFSSQAQHVLLASKSYAERHHHEFLTAEHLLLVLLSEQKIESLLESCGSDVQMVKNSLYKYLDLNIPILIAGETIESLGFKNVIVAATEHCLSCEKPVIELEDLLISIYDDDRTYASYYLKASGVSRLALISGITYQAQNEEDGADEPEDVSFEGNDAQSLSETEQNQKDGAEEKERAAQNGFHNTVSVKRFDCNRYDSTIPRRPGQHPGSHFVRVRQNIRDHAREGDGRHSAADDEREDAFREAPVPRHVEDRLFVRRPGPQIGDGRSDRIRSPEAVRAGLSDGGERIFGVEKSAYVPARLPDDLFFRTLVHIE